MVTNILHSYEAMRQNAMNNGTWNEETQASTTEVKVEEGKPSRHLKTTKP